MDKVYLIGLPGCGKTTLGKQLAKEIEWDFFDMDEAIVSQTGKTIPEIFAQEGENMFRQYEKEVLAQTFKLTNTIISTGGGAACFFDNIQQMNIHGATVFIDVNPDEITKRLYGNTQDDRPLLQGKSLLELTKELQTKRNDRLKFYNQAKLILTNDKLHMLDLMNMLKYSNLI